MSEDLRQALEARRDEEIRDVGSRLLADPSADIGEGLRRIEVYSKLLGAVKPQPSRDRLWAIVVAVGCVVLAGLLWSFPVSRTKITLEIQSDALALTLAKPWSLMADLSLGDSFLRLEGMTSLDAPALGLAIASPQRDAWLQLEGGKVSITQLSLEQDGLLTIEHLTSGQLDMFSRGAVLRGQLMVLDSTQLTVGKGITDPGLETRFELPVPETLAFQAIGEGAAPTKFTIRSQKPWILRDLRVKALKFSRQSPQEPGSVAFESAIKKATVTLPEVSKIEMLRENDRLSLKEVSGRVVDLWATDTINVIFEGTARQIQVGPEGFERNLVPTYLQYFYHQQSLAFFWSTIGFLWGILWSIRKTIFP